MKVKKPAYMSLLLFTLFFGVYCALCSSAAALGATFPYGGMPQWWNLIGDGLKHKGVLYLDGMGFAFATFGSAIISALSLLAFALALVAYRRKKAGRKPMLGAVLLFGVAVLVLVGSFMLAGSPSCTENPQGSDDTVYCSFLVSTNVAHPPLIP